ncbi:glycine cleavage system aminomethyltransferase GcvT [Granulosicoccus sp.]|nr:glycine cleavage system aminomethyltransferase GcvT [Granulosicoccus sp.]MDB4222880.1 glycine cleavage system aminomethyltransferase GcvT [Granulosicoccus sp.]
MSQHTSLYEAHLTAGGKMVDFAGYSLPVHYGSLVNEHHAVRNKAGVFDVSHMTIVDVTGAGARQWLRKLLTNDVSKLSDGRALYSCMCNEQGGVIDDLIVYSLGEGDYRVIVNAGTREKDIAWFEKRKTEDMSFEVKDNLALIAIQGPEAVAIASDVLDEKGISGDKTSSLKRFSAWQTGQWFIARTGYTGEDGLEIAMPASAAQAFWHQLLDKGVQPAGLGARDTLRLEAGMSLYGNDLDEEHTPAESGVGWTVDLADADRHFIGRAVLEEQKLVGARYVQIGLTLESRGVLRQGQVVVRGGIEVGSITSGTYSPTLEKTIAIARVTEKFDGSCEVVIRDKKYSARVIPVPFLS